jgi:hypothetical protein
VEEEHLGVGVVEQVDQLVLEVAPVRIDGNGALLECGEADLEILGAVVEVLRDLGVRPDAGLLERPTLEFGPTPACWSALATRAARSSNSPQLRRSSPWTSAGRSEIASAIASQIVAKCICMVGSPSR